MTFTTIQLKKRYFMLLLTIKLHDISFLTLASAMLPCDVFEKTFGEKNAPTSKYASFVLFHISTP